MSQDDLEGAIATFQIVVDRYPEDVQSLKNLLQKPSPASLPL
mgnify:CR=1 FL=1